VGRTRTTWRRSATRPRQLGAALSRTQALALLLGLSLTVAAVAVAAVLVSPNRARSFDLIHGSVFLADVRAPVAVDLATGKPTVRLLGASTQVNAGSSSDLSVTALADSTLLLNAQTGEFNMVDGTGFVVKTTAGGVPLPQQAGASKAMAVAAGAEAYVVRSGTNTSAFLVNTATVQSATNAKAKITPRASAVLNQPSSAAPGSAVSADGDLWLLTGPPAGQTLRQLGLPADSQTGAQLTATVRATVTGVAALASTPLASGAEQVALADSSQLRLFSGGAEHTVAVNGLNGVDQILPVSSSQSMTAFLYHDAKGWAVVSAAIGGTGADVKRIAKIGHASSLAAPAMSNGKLYTMDELTGALYQLSPDGSAAALSGQAAYPVSVKNGKSVEAADFGDAQVMAERSRVLFNSPDHVLALAAFTDGSHQPGVIDKSSAADLNAAGGASAITTKHNSTIKKNSANAPKPQTPQPKPVTPVAPAINNNVSCKTTTQTPHVPTITTATSASRSVLLNWNYPLLDSQDCAPSTYVVTLKTLTEGSPGAPGQVTVQGQDGVNITGLYPGTRYQISVTAYLNGRGTASPPVIVTTGPEGPAAPTAVTGATDSSGSWSVSWHACGSVKSGCVPATNWTVIPKFCDGLGLSNQPPPIPVIGDPTLTQFSTSFAGGTALLGRGMSFTVQGISQAGNVGTTSAATACTYSWSPPNPAQLHLGASKPDQTSLGGTTSSTFTLDVGSTPLAATGGLGAQITFQLLAGGRVVASKGPGTAITAVFDGISAGTSYTGKAIVAPPHHPEAAVTVGPVTVSTRSGWPALAITNAKVTAGSDPTKGTLAVNLGGLSSSAASGERFNLTGNSVFSCGGGNVSLPLNNSGAFDPSSYTITANVDLLQYYGDCSVNIQLAEDPGTETNPSVFGDTESPTLTSSVSMPGIPTGGLGPSEFSAAWDAAANRNHRSTITVQLNSNDPSLFFVVGWSEQVSDNDQHDHCGSASSKPTVTIEVRQSCVDDHGAEQNAWTVVVKYRSLGAADLKTVTVQVTGTPPTYVPPSSAPPSSSAPASSTAPPPSSPPTTSPAPAPTS
jgi:hypothetical protein